MMFPLLLFLFFVTFAADAVELQTGEIKLNYVSDCCAPRIRNDVNKLIKCVNASAEQTVKDGWLPTKKKKFAFVTSATKDIFSFSSYSFAINQAYCEQNGHLLRMPDPVTSNYEPNHPAWNKVKILEVALKTWAKDCDYIVWLDADLIILDMHLNLDTLVKQYSNAHLIASACPESTTSSDIMNSGFVILKNSDFVSGWLLKEWWTFENRITFNDQEVFNKLYMKYGEKMSSKCVIVAPDLINSDPPATLRQKPDNQVLHLMGEYWTYRKIAFRSGFDEICRATYTPEVNSDDEIFNSTNNDDDDEETRASKNCVSDSGSNADTVYPNKVQAQLGVNQHQLFMIAFVEYTNRSNTLLNEFETRFAAGQSSNFDQISGLKYIIGRYLDILHVVDTDWTKQDKKAFKAGKWTSADQKLYENVLEGFDSSAFPDLKEQREAGQSVLGAHPRNSGELRAYLFDLFMRNLRLSEDVNKEKNDKLRNSKLDTPSPEFQEYRFERSSVLYATIDFGAQYVKKYFYDVYGSRSRDPKTGRDIPMQPNKKFKMMKKTLMEMIAMSDEMLQLVHFERKPHTHHLRGDLFIDASLVRRLEGNVEECLEYLLMALEEKEEEAKVLGDLGIVKTLVMIGDYMSTIGKYLDALPYFDRAIKIQKLQLGETVIAIGSHYFMAGQARAAGGMFSEAIEYFNKAIRVYKQHPGTPEYERDIPRAQQLMEYCKKKLAD